jgi:RHS repeat-associated protein
MVEGFLYRDELQPAAWLNGDGSVRARFVYGGKANVPEYMVTSAGATYRLVTDQVGSMRLVVDMASGALIERLDWDEFGNVLSDSAPRTQPFGFAGGLRDSDTGLTRFGGRDYDPGTGRWTTKDLAGLEGDLNVYEYAANDPISHIDPSGDDWLDWDLQESADFFGGFGDTITSIPFTDLSLTRLARDVTGAGDVVNKCSGAYTGGKWAGRTWEAGMAGAAAWRGIQPGGWMNSNRYLRVGFGRHEGFKWFRVAGEWVKGGHWDIFRVGPWR